MDEKIDITEDDARDITVEKGDIEFDHVYFNTAARRRNMCCPIYPLKWRPGRQSELSEEPALRKLRLCS